VRGVQIPVVISGSWDNLSYKPDLSGLLNNPQGAVEGLRDMLRGQGSGDQKEDSGGSQQPAPSNPVDQLRGLFGR
jgi:hypothetical protein